MKPRPPALLLIGTRPEALKLAPVAHAFRKRGHPFRIILSGQHPALASQLLQAEGLHVDHDLRVHRPGNSLSDLVAAILERLTPILARETPSILLVQGDTATAFAGALAAFYAGVPVGHVEAGLRTGDLAEPFPEEGHRAMVARLASLHFAPTRQAAGRLVREGIDPEAIHIVGNTGIDALEAALGRLACPEVQEELENRFCFLRAEGPPVVLATVHRRENQGHRLRAICAGLARVAGLGVAQILLPLHPNPHVADVVEARLGGLSHVRLLPPLDHQALVWLMQRSRLVLTDSGGLQEEAPSLGVSTLVVREATERVEGVEAGVATLVPLRADAIARAVKAALLLPPIAPVPLYGDGQASARIVNAIEAWLGAPASPAWLSAPVASRP
ncbi:non-hydrolyzing UDP-N-acetylglucosamine 2-epimerase [Thermaurantiacus sp.]